MIVYKVTNLNNKKVYIGKTIQPLTRRKSDHIKSANNGSETNFHRAIRKYGVDSFKWELIRKYSTLEEMNNAEIKYISEYDTFKNGYNMTEGGDGGTTYRKGDELYNRIKHKLGKWPNGNPGATLDAIAKRMETFKNVEWSKGTNHSNYGHSHNKGCLLGDKNPMFGKTPTNARRVIIDSITYPSITRAATELGISKNTIRRRCINNKIKNYKYE
jgi:group I intron endonuclease